MLCFYCVVVSGFITPQVKSADLMKTLEETEKGFERDDVSGVIRCIVCDVTVNSPQLLATHIAGNKHKQRASKRSGDCSSAPPAKRHCPGMQHDRSKANCAVGVWACLGVSHAAVLNPEVTCETEGLFRRDRWLPCSLAVRSYLYLYNDKACIYLIKTCP